MADTPQFHADSPPLADDGPEPGAAGAQGGNRGRRLCARPGCGAGLRFSYYRFCSAGCRDGEPGPARVCQDCGTPLHPHQAIACSPRCASRLREAKAKPGRLAAKLARARRCLVCPAPLLARGQRVTCSRTCRYELARRRGTERRAAITCAMPDCDRAPRKWAKYCGPDCRRRSRLPDWGMKPLSVATAAHA